MNTVVENVRYQVDQAVLMALLATVFVRNTRTEIVIRFSTKEGESVAADLLKLLEDLTRRRTVWFDLKRPPGKTLPTFHPDRFRGQQVKQGSPERAETHVSFGIELFIGQAVALFEYFLVCPIVVCVKIGHQIVHVGQHYGLRVLRRLALCHCRSACYAREPGR